MVKGVNILRILRLLVILLPMMFMVTSCIKGDEQTPKGDVVDPNKDAEEIAEQHNNCWQKHVVAGLYDTMGSAAMKAYEGITRGALTVMMLAWAIWFSFRMLKHVSSVMEENPAEVWNDVFRKMFICFACGVAASSPGAILFFLNMLVFPIYSAFLEFGGRILAVANVEMTQGLEVGGVVQNWSTDPVGACRLAGGTKASLSGFPEAPKTMMSCLICAMNKRMNLGYALSFRVLQADGFMAKVVGLIIMACFTIVKLGFVFYLVDSIFKFTMMVIILPLLIMGYAFEKTKSKLQQGVVQMIDSAAFMTFIAMMISVTFMAIAEVIQANPDIFSGKDNDNFKEASIGMMCLILICFLVVSSLEVSQKLSSAIVGSTSGSEFQKKVTVVAKMVAGWMTGGLSRLVGKLGFVKKYKAKRDEMTHKIKSFAGRVKEDD